MVFNSPCNSLAKHILDLNRGAIYNKFWSIQMTYPSLRDLSFLLNGTRPPRYGMGKLDKNHVPDNRKDFGHFLEIDPIKQDYQEIPWKTI